jgi:hypothetical protein
VGRFSDFDINLKEGAQAELWVLDLRRALAGNGRVEVKAPKPFLREQSFYVEYKCRGRDGIWRPSGISTTKSDLMVFTFGKLPGGAGVWRRPPVRRPSRRAAEGVLSDRLPDQRHPWRHCRFWAGEKCAAVDATVLRAARALLGRS